MAIAQEPDRADLSRQGQFVRRQIRSAMNRVRMLDIASALLGLAIGVLAYGLVMILLDRWLNFSQIVRQVALVGLILGSAAFLWFRLSKTIRYGVNPYYAALHIEQLIPDAKNSIVNWLDLNDDAIPPAVRAALERRAAEDLEETDVQEAIPGKHLVWMGAVVVGICVGLLIALAFMRPGQFMSLVNRAFAPFDNSIVEKQTQIQLITPEGGHATVPVNQSVFVSVYVQGRIPKSDKPDALRLVIRRNPDDAAFEERILEPGNDPREWSTRVPPHQVQNGFWYRVVGGDDETSEYRIQVRSSPMLTHFEATLNYRPYLRWKPIVVSDPNLEQMRGTAVSLRAFANRAVRGGRLVFDGEPAEVLGQPVPEYANALDFKFVIEKDTRYRIWFETADGESNRDPLPYTIKALLDQPPAVEFTKPEELKLPEPKSDMRIPANGLLRLEGIARDDFGIRKLTLRMRLGKHGKVAPKPYRDEKAYRLDNGRLMRSVEYADFVELEKLTDEAGNRLHLQTGDILYYWLEAEDACDYPQPNVAKTREYKVIITDPKTEDQEKDDRKKQAQDRKDDVEKKNDDNRQKENEENKQKDEQQKKNGGEPDKKPNDDPNKDPNADPKKDPNNKDGKSDAEKKIEEMLNEMNKDKKPSDKPQPMPPPKEKDQGDPKDPMGKDPMGKDPMGKGMGDPKDAKDTKPGPAGSNPGKGGNDAERNGNSKPMDPGKFEDPNDAFRKKAGDLQLEEFKKKVTKEMLKERGITEEDWNKYLEAMARKNAQPTKPGPVDPKDIESGDRTKGGSNTGVSRVKTNPNGTATDLRNDGQTTAPPEYKDAAAKFSELLSKPKKK